ncbi:FAM120A (predicted), partial [Pycnogonum litorale]
GVVAEDAEYAIFDPPRYFSSELLKLTYKGSLETKEIILDEVAKSMNLHPKRFCVFAALLGNYLLRDEDLASFYQTLVKDSKTNSDTLIKALISYVRELPAIDNVDGIGCQVFGSPSNSVNQERIQRFKECVQYYLNGTKDGFLRYRPPHIGRRQDAGRQVPSHMQPKKHTQQPKIKIKQKESSVANDTPSSSATSQNENDATPNPTDASKFASETEENEIMSLSAYKEATVSAPVPAPEIVIEPPNALQQDQNTPAEATVNEVEEKQNKGDQKTTAVKSNGGTSLLSNSTSSSSSDSSPSRVSPEVSTWSANNQKKAESAAAAVPKLLPLPKIPPEVMRTASERHQKGLMSPWIYQILTQGEIKIPVSIEEEIPKDLPSGNAMYRNLRQSVYAVLFNLHHIIFMAKQKGHSEDTIQDIIVKEWSWCKSNQYKSPELVKAVQLGWKVPTIQRLWFGSTLEDKRRRMRVFLSCLRSDTPLMLKTSNVPQHLLILCCVLRYLLSDQTMRVLQKQELDAFLAQAVSPQLMDAQGIQLMQLPLVTNRGIQLASLFMQGVEHALFVNDACGAPVPWLMCCVWLFFDGKLFHQKLLKAHTAKNLTDICDGQLDQVVKVERMRAAILENLQVQFARPPLAMGGSNHFSSIPPGHMNHHMNPGSMGRGRGGKKMYARGGQLEIAGVVVGSWGANYGQVPARSRGMSMSSGMTPAGATFSRPGGLRGMNRNYSNSNYQNRYMQTYPGYPGRAGRRPGGGGGNSNNNANKSG